MQKLHQDAAFEIQLRDSVMQRKARLSSTELEDVVN